MKCLLYLIECPKCNQQTQTFISFTRLPEYEKCINCDKRYSKKKNMVKKLLGGC